VSKESRTYILKSVRIDQTVSRGAAIAISVLTSMVYEASITTVIIAAAVTEAATMYLLLIDFSEFAYLYLYSKYDSSKSIKEFAVVNIVICKKLKWQLYHILYPSDFYTSSKIFPTGLPENETPLGASSLINARRSLAGSVIGGIRETQEMLDFCSEHNIASDIELIPIQKVNEAYPRVVKSDVRYRFVIDTKSLD
jgi:hypothetical protein